jgi:hypothetical protein
MTRFWAGLTLPLSEYAESVLLWRGEQEAPEKGFPTFLGIPQLDAVVAVLRLLALRMEASGSIAVCPRNSSITRA